MDKKATWIWYPGDFEIHLHTRLSLRRTERGTIIPPFWRLDTYYNSVKFYKDFELEKPETVYIYVEGKYNITVDGQYFYGDSTQGISLPEGRHEIIVSVVNLENVPSIFVQSETLVSDGTWKVSCNNHEWPFAACWNFDVLDFPTSAYKLETMEIQPVSTKREDSAILVDFGRQTFGYVKLNHITGQGKVMLYYGESLEEATAGAEAETFDEVRIGGEKDSIYVLQGSKAFRYIYLKLEKGVDIGNVSALYEYLPVEYKGHFKCSDDLVNKIWETSVYTLHLNTREFFLDGIKRDRWVWSGDAYQSFLMNYYTFFNQDVNRRTFIALRGKDPVETHINHIMDYSFYWVIGLYDHYLYTGDLDFIKQNYGKALSLMEFCLGRRNSEGMMEGLRGDWVFVDWADMDKRGELSTEQILLCKSLETMALFAKLLKDEKNMERFDLLAKELKEKVLEVFWDEEQGGLTQNRFEGQVNRQITKHANMFAMMFGYLDTGKIEKVKQQVLLNPDVPKIKTPYMRFYELSALCDIGEHEYVVDEIKAYWGGMLDLGATSFWEEFDPAMKGSEHYAMYGRPYGKSLCHAWGASPVYLLGRYFLGVRPLTPGYETYMAEPELGGLEWMEGTVPTPGGHIAIYKDEKIIRIKSTDGKGILRVRSAEPPVSTAGDCKQIQDGLYEIVIQPQIEYEIKYFKNM